MLLLVFGIALWLYLLLYFFIKEEESIQHYVNELHKRKLNISINFPPEGICKVIISNSYSHFEFVGPNLNEALRAAWEYVLSNLNKFPIGY